MDEKTKNRALYLAWLRRTAPPLYYDALRAAENAPREYTSGAVGGFWSSAGDVFKDFTSQVATALPGIASAYAGYQTQKDLIKANTARAQQGQAPLAYDVNGQLTTQMPFSYNSQDLMLAQTAQTQNYLMIGAAFFLGLILLMGRRD